MGRKKMTDEEKAKKSAEKENFRVRAMVILNAWGYEVESLMRTHDNSTALTVAQTENGRLLLLEKNHEVFIFQSVGTIERKPKTIANFVDDYDKEGELNF